ncbi:MAG: hypothetical protein LAO21_19880 [Acidobacteriia bacterium]|nr:hypothetical protein [Terriglobia bacterium]
MTGLSKLSSSQTNRPAYLARLASASVARIRRHEYHHGAHTSTKTGSFWRVASASARV